MASIPALSTEDTLERARGFRLMDKSKQELIEEISFYKQYIQQLECSREADRFADMSCGVDGWYQRILKTMNEGFSIRDQNTLFTYVNDKFCDMLGYSRNELLGYPIGHFVDKTCLPVLEEELQKRRSGLRSTYELKWKRKDGTPLYTILSAAPLFDDAGRHVGGFGIMTDITPRRLAEKKVKDYQRKLRSLASELSLAEERERRRIAAELHDRIGQSLAITKIKLGVLGEKVHASNVRQEIGEIRSLIDQTIQDTRSLTLEISPPILYELGFEAAVEWLSEHVQQQHGLSTAFSCDGRIEPLGSDVRVLLFKVVQELLINIVKHAGAEAASVSLYEEGDRLRIAVQDNGRGFEVERIKSSSGHMAGFGLFNICERINDLGGRVDVRSAPGEGTCITVSAPRKSPPLRAFEREGYDHDEDPSGG